MQEARSVGREHIPCPGAFRASGSIGDLLSDDPPAVYRAIWGLADYPPGPTLLRATTAPRHVDARPERIAQLIADLGGENFKTRRRHEGINGFGTSRLHLRPE